MTQAKLSFVLSQKNVYLIQTKWCLYGLMNWTIIGSDNGFGAKSLS